jgi:uncharacterized Zn-finger protein
VCEKSFNASYELRKHQVVHSELRKFACGVCGKEFKRNDVKKRHEQIHLNDKPGIRKVPKIKKKKGQKKSTRGEIKIEK